MMEEKKENLKQFLLMKNLLAGAAFVNDVCVTKVPVLEHLEEKSENELSSLSMKIAKTGEKFFVKLGQDLHSLGSIDKQYGKSAPGPESGVCLPYPGVYRHAGISRKLCGHRESKQLAVVAHGKRIQPDAGIFRDNHRVFRGGAGEYGIGQCRGDRGGGDIKDYGNR